MLTTILLRIARIMPFGGWRFVKLAAHYDRSLQAKPVTIENIPYTIFIDLRDASTCNLFLNNTSTGSRKLRLILPKVMRPGDIFYDVGANLGMVSAVAHQAIGPTGKIVAFEPNVRVSRLYEKTFAGSSNVIINNVALAEHAGELPFYLSPTSVRSSFSPIRGVEPITVAVRPMADVISEFGAPNVVKVDVEGHEEQVFRGVQDHFLGEKCPIIIFEAHSLEEFGSTAAMISKLHGGPGMFLHVRDGGQLAPIDETKHSSDYFYVPEHYRERVDEILGQK
ncbi:MAG: FkbM family methyltransferase [Pseudomonadota bacterium]